MTETTARGATFRDEDWYAEDLTRHRYVDCIFRDVDLTEAHGSGVVFESCTFENTRFNAAVLDAPAFVGCDVRRTSFFGATLTGAKLSGSVFVDCAMRPVTVDGGLWQGVTMRGAKLAQVDLSGVSLNDADLTDADLTDAVLAGCDLSNALLRNADLSGADLRGATLHGVSLVDVRLRGTRLDLAGAVRLAEQHGAVVSLRGLSPRRPSRP